MMKMSVNGRILAQDEGSLPLLLRSVVRPGSTIRVEMPLMGGSMKDASMGSQKDGTADSQKLSK